MTISFRPVVLEGRSLRLVPLTPEHAAGLAACLDQETFRYYTTPYRPISVDEAGFVEYAHRRAGDGSVALVMIRKAASPGERDIVCGCSSFLDIRAAHYGVEIGSTFIGVSSRGTFVNPESKYLMLRHAFEVVGCRRVQLKCDARNERSRRAIAKLGATFEGVLRRHMSMPDGHLRDTVMFSVIAEEWPELKRRLETRLGWNG
ncbi:MAG: GNAT family protein [Planctomycetota bacterium]|nr:GNAT family protein [Planctomycetota bacterium]